MTQAFLQRSKSVLAFGPEVMIPRADTSKETVDTATAKIKSAVQSLRLEVDAYRRTQ